MSDEIVPENQPSLDVPLVPSPADTNPPANQGKKMGRPAGLTKRARCFLELLMAGKKTVEAYKLAGYDGEEGAAYHLRFILREQLFEMLKARGMSREGIMMQLRKGLEDPSWEEANGVPLKFDQKLNLMKFLAKLTPEKDMFEKPKVTPFTLNLTTENVENVTVTTQGEPVEERPENLA